MRRVRTALLLLGLAGAAAPVGAHTLGEGYVFVDIADTSLSGRVHITLTDLDRALGLDADGDGKVVEEELEEGIERVEAYVRDRVSLGTRDLLEPIDIVGHEVIKLSLGQYVELTYTTGVRAVPDVIVARYEMLFDVDPKHRGFLVIASNTKTGTVNKGEDTAVRFSPDRSTRELDLTRLGRWSSLITFLRHGIWHIWIGFDHILFLLALILPAVMVRRDTGWEPVKSFRSALWNVVKIVTLFTIAHTITLSLAALNVIRLPSTLVESIIAASVAVAALSNIYPIVRRRIGWVVFGFGLFHGFGFAGVLEHLVTNTSNLIVDLAGFNAGVEIGQVAIVAVAFPFLFALRSATAYRRVLLPIGSAAIAIFALGWLFERIAGLEFMPL